jgi:hypothetical protein
MSFSFQRFIKEVGLTGEDKGNILEELSGHLIGSNASLRPGFFVLPGEALRTW